VLANVGIWILLIADYSRFVRTSDRRRAIAVASTAGLGMNFVVLPLLGGWLALHAGSANPGSYAVELTGAIGLVWVVITQLRVQEGNYYLGSLSLSTFFSRTFGRRPAGRPLFLTAVGVLAFVLALFGIVDHLTGVLTFMGVFLLAWVSTVVASLLAERRRLADGTTWIEHRRPYLKDWGAPTLAGLATASIVGGALALTGWPSPYGGFLGIAVGIVLAPAITLLGNHRPISGIHSDVTPPPDWRDAGPLTDLDVSAPANEMTCANSGITVLRTDACEWPVGSGRVVAARVAELE
jgi:cytosine permease